MYDVRGPLQLDIRSDVHRLALHQIAKVSGFDVVINLGDVAGVRVVDVLPETPCRADILLAEHNAVRSWLALGALTAGMVTAVIEAARPEQLLNALRCVEEGTSSIPTSMVVTAGEVAALSGRQHQILNLIARGLVRDSTISQTIHLSSATVKREIRGLYDWMKVSDRHSLAAGARRLGYGAPLSVRDLQVLGLDGTCASGASPV